MRSEFGVISKHSLREGKAPRAYARGGGDASTMKRLTEPLLRGIRWCVRLMDRSATSPPLFPDSIILFQEPLEEMCETIQELEEEIEITVVHEVAHFVGISEERLEELGYG